jgi:hypothetical protein
MPAVFVPGVPHTPVVWHKVLARVARPDAITLALPGFATLLPTGFQPTKEGYVEWLQTRLGRQPARSIWSGMIGARCSSSAPSR